MSSEIRLANAHSDFWNGLFPMADAFIRAQNSKPHQFAGSIFAVAPPDQRGIINETGFFLFKKSVESGKRPSMSDESLTESLKRAFQRNERLPKSKPLNIDTTLLVGRLEAVTIAERLSHYFAREQSEIHVNPKFPGCGWVSEAEGDVLCGNTLFEVKSGDRHFRISDLRQLLAYCALNFSSNSYVIENVALINPRSGAIIRESLDNLCKRISGAPAVHVLGEIVAFISEPSTGYLAI